MVEPIRKLTLNPEQIGVVQHFIDTIKAAGSDEAQLRSLVAKNKHVVERMLQTLLIHHNGLLQKELSKFADLAAPELSESAPGVSPGARISADRPESSVGGSGAPQHPAIFATGMQPDDTPSNDQFEVDVVAEPGGPDNKMQLKARLRAMPSFDSHKAKQEEKYRLTIESPKPVPAPRNLPRLTPDAKPF